MAIASPSSVTQSSFLLFIRRRRVQLDVRYLPKLRLEDAPTALSRLCIRKTIMVGVQHDADRIRISIIRKEPARAASGCEAGYFGASSPRVAGLKALTATKAKAGLCLALNHGQQAVLDEGVV